MARASLYRREEAADATLLEHVDLAAWLETPFVPPDLRWDQVGTVAPPPVLAEAREALAPLLFSGPTENR